MRVAAVLVKRRPLFFSSCLRSTCATRRDLCTSRSLTRRTTTTTCTRKSLSLLLLISSFSSSASGSFLHLPYPFALRNTSTTINRTMRTITSGAITASSAHRNKGENESEPFLGEIPSHMNCIVYSKNGGRSSLVAMQERPTPAPGQKNRILVKVMAVGLNPVDAKRVVGDKLPSALQWMSRWFLGNNKTIPGFDFSGIVAEESHNGFTKGDKVFGCMPPLEGTLAEYISCPTNQVAYMPRNYNYKQAAALPLVGLTALQCLSPHVPSRTSLETSILVIGASGGTGHVSLQVARELGAKHRTAVCSARNADFVTRDCGATAVIDYTTCDSTEQMLEQLCAAPGCPYSVVLDCVTSADPRDKSGMDYRKLVQKMHTNDMLTDDYVHRRLGGPSLDWMRAGWERLWTGSNADAALKDSSSCCGNCCWMCSSRHERLFWIRFPACAPQLQMLCDMAQGKPGDPSYKRNLRVQIQKTYSEMTADNVNQAFDDILQRRVQGKIVVQVHQEEEEMK